MKIGLSFLIGYVKDFIPWKPALVISLALNKLVLHDCAFYYVKLLPDGGRFDDPMFVLTFDLLFLFLSAKVRVRRDKYVILNNIFDCVLKFCQIYLKKKKPLFILIWIHVH